MGVIYNKAIHEPGSCKMDSWIAVVNSVKNRLFLNSI